MKIIVLGSGPDRIGKTSELDKFASKALSFLKKEKIEVVYVDSNPMALAGTPTTDNRVFLEPLTLKVLENIIEIEKPDGIIFCFGGFLAIRLATFLDREGILDRYNVRLLGTSVSSLKSILEEEVFQKKLSDMEVPVVERKIAHTSDECVMASQAFGFPFIMRPSFAIEGSGGYLVYNVEEVEEFSPLALNLSPVREVVLERVKADWLQLAIECIHDANSPGEVYLTGTFEALEGGVGVHFGNTAILSPAPTLKGDLLERALKLAELIAGNLKICGSFQIHFGYSPNSGEIIVRSLRPCLTRLSSLTSVLSPLPLAEINACLSLGMTFKEVKKKLQFNYLSSFDEKGFTAIRFPLFSQGIQRPDIINTTMCSIGAKLLLGRSLSEALAKVVNLTIKSKYIKKSKWEAALNSEETYCPSLMADRLLEIVQELQKQDEDFSLKQYSKINPCILPAIAGATSVYHQLREVADRLLPQELLEEAKSLGFSDEGISHLTGLDRGVVKDACDRAGIRSYTMAIGTDTRSTKGGPYFFSYNSKHINREDQGAQEKPKKRPHALLLLGPGAYRMGWGPEVDQSLIKTALSFKEQGEKIVLINDNPDAVSLDAEIMDSIYLETPSLDLIELILSDWAIDGVIHQFCFHLPTGLDDLLQKRGIQILGTPFSSLNTIQNTPSLWKSLQKIGTPLMNHAFASDVSSALKEAGSLGYPVLIKLTDKYLNPEAEIIYNDAMLRHFLEPYKDRISQGTPIFMEAFKEDIISAETLALSDGKDTRILAFLENIEEYGIHGDNCASTIPPWSIGDHQMALAEEVLGHIASHFHIVGHLKLQFAIKGHKVYVAGLSPYPGRNTPFVERVISQPIHAWTAHLLLGGAICDLGAYNFSRPDRFYVKESVFPFARFPHMDPVLSPQMSSTGQVMGHNDAFGKAYLKSQIAVNPKILKKGKVFVSGRDSEKEGILQVAKKLSELDFSLVSTQGTALFLLERGIQVEHVHKVSVSRPNIIDLIKNDEISLIINIPGGFQSKQDEQRIRRATIEHDIPLVSTITGALLMVRGIEEIRRTPLSFTPI